MSFIDERYEYELPKRMIAQEPPGERGASRLMVLERDSGKIGHVRFVNLPHYLRPGDCLVLNDTRVICARLPAKKSTGKKVELFMVKALGGSRWEAMARPSRKVGTGEVLSIGESGESVRVEGELRGGRKIIDFVGLDPVDVIERLGEVPLPPYIRREAGQSDRNRYQTVYARNPGAVAAPTAGLHFTDELLREIEGMGVRLVRVCLHVGPGTFRPIREERFENHVQEEEYFEVGEDAARTLNAIRAGGGRIVAVGTTAVRVLETLSGTPFEARSGWTGIFIHPPYRFRNVDLLLTNFHLPRSTTLLLAAAFAGRDFLGEAYRLAVHEGYRFYSYGDAMLIV
jgi:S-adenosylmethionine:tRNA ribosyltransferase-isomerase